MKKTLIKIPVEVSARHIHLSQTDLDKLFGKNYKLRKLRDLSQPGEFASQETVKLAELNLRVLGPVRQESQIEMSLTDAINLGLAAPIKISGDLKQVKTVAVIYGPKGKTRAKTIVAQRHVHCSPAAAKRFGLKTGQKASVQIVGERGLVFDNVVVRVAPKMKLSCHIDTDEANACGLGKVCGVGKLIL